MDVPSSIILEVLAIPDWFSPEVIETIQKATDYHNTGQYEVSGWLLVVNLCYCVDVC